MSKKNVSLVLSLLTLIVTGCATSYQPLGFFGGGYTDMALSEDIYKVSFEGNPHTSESTVQDYLFRRCAEITLQKGYKYFVVLNGTTDTSHETLTIPNILHTNSDYSIMSYSQSTSEKYENIVIIKLLKNNKNCNAAFSASIVLNNFPKK